MAESDCVDWRIIEALIEQLELCTAVNGYNTDIQVVELIGSKAKGNNGQRTLVVVPNETDPGVDYTFREDVLPFVLFYTDGEVQQDGDYTSYIERYKNVQADITKCLMTNITLNNLCQCITMGSYGYFDDIDEVVFMCVNIDRLIVKSNPYLIKN